MGGYYRLSNKVECCFNVVDTLINCAGFSCLPCTVHKHCFICICIYFICNTITFEQAKNIPASFCVKKKTWLSSNCYNRAFIFHPIIAESIRECERSTHKRPVSCLQAEGTDCLCLPVRPSICLSVCLWAEKQRRWHITHSQKDEN